MRTKKSLVNMVVGFLVQLELAIVGILVRRIFIQYLSLEYLGSHSVFSNVLTVLSFATCGASAVSYIGIKAFVTHDEKEINTAYRIIHLYNWISTVFLMALGGIAGLFLPYFLNNVTSFSWGFLTSVYYLYLADICISSWSGMNGTPGYYDCVIKLSQNQAVCSVYNFIVTNLYLFLQCAVLIIKQDYLLYLLVSVLTKLLYVVLTRFYCYHYFPYLRKKVSVSWKQLKELRLFEEIKSNFAIMLASIVFHGTDSMVITGVVGIIAAGLYSNYTTFQNQLVGLVGKFLNGMSMSVADFVHSSESEEEKKVLFYRVQFLCGFVGVVCSICYFNLAQPFITLFFGNGLLLENEIVCGVSVLVFLGTYESAVAMFRHAMGHYWLDQNYHIFSAVINLTVSLILVRACGIVGVIIGTVLGQLCSMMGYLVVAKKKAVSTLKYYEWWRLFLLWTFFLSGAIFVSVLTIARMPLTIPFVFARGICSLLLSFMVVFIVCMVSRTARDSLRFYYMFVIKGL